MRPILYAADETAFTSNGMGRIADATRCIVTEERNGVYLCEFDVPVTSPMYSLIQEGRYIAAIHDDRHDVQPFEIYGRSAPIDGLVTFYAHHLSYKLSNVILKPFTAQSCAMALQQMQTQVYNRNPFTFWTDKSVVAPFRNKVPASCRSMLAGQEGSILDVYGTGEYEFDKWAVKLHLHRGNDNGVAIRYGVNLTDIQQETDASGSYSAVAPFWASEDGQTVVTLPEGYIVSPNAPTVRYPWTTQSGEYMTTEGGEILEFAVKDVRIVPLDLSGDFDEQPTEAQLRQLAAQRLASGQPWKPKENIKVSFVDMAHTEDYAGVSALQRVSLCDSVSVYCGPLGVAAVKMKVIRTVYNVLTETYDEIELGEARTNFADTIMSQVDKITEGFTTSTQLEAAVEHATQLITGGLGGYVVFNLNANGQPEELLIMDTPDTSTAVNVWRFNKNGLGHSHNGYNGPFNDVALTADGRINANLITTGKVQAAYIDADNLKVKAANITGTLVIGQLPSDVATEGDVTTITESTIQTTNVTAQNLKVKAANITGTLTIGQLPSSVAETSDIPTKVSELTNDSGFQNSAQVTTITNNTIQTTNVTAQNLKVNAANVSGILTVGGQNNTNGQIIVKNAIGSTIGNIDSTGIKTTLLSNGYYYTTKIADGRISLSSRHASASTERVVGEILWSWGDGSTMEGQELLEIDGYGGRGILIKNQNGPIRIEGESIYIKSSSREIGIDCDLGITGTFTIQSSYESGGIVYDDSHHIEVTNGLITAWTRGG